MSRGKLARALLLVAVIAAGGLLRILNLDCECLWFDEVFSIHAASHSWNELFQFVALDLIHPPAFYVLLKLWISIGGEGVVWLRILSIILFSAGVAIFLLLSRELKQNFSSTIIGLLFLVFNGTLLKYSLEIRMYPLLIFLSLLSTWLFVRLLNGKRAFWLLIVANIILVHTHYFGWFLVMSEAVCGLLLDRRRWGLHLLAAVSTALSFVTWLMMVLSASTTGTGLEQNIGWMQRPGIREIATVLLNIVEPVYFQMLSNEPISLYWFTIPLLVVVTAGMLIGFLGQTSDDSTRRRSLIVLAVLGSFPFVAAFALSWTSPYSIWGARHLVICLPPLYLLAAMIIESIPSRTTRIAFQSVIAVLIAAAVAFVLSMPARPEPIWCAIATLMDGAVDPNTPIYTTEDLIAYHAWFEMGRSRKGKVFRIEGVDGLAENRAYFLPRGFNDVEHATVAEIESKRLWLLFRAREIRETEPPLRNLALLGYTIASRKTVNANGEVLALFLLER